MLNSLQSLKQLEGLVKQASEALQKSGTENRSLKEKLGRLETEHKRVKDELREAKMTLSRHERLKNRLSRMLERLEKLG